MLNGSIFQHFSTQKKDRRNFIEGEISAKAQEHKEKQKDEEIPQFQKTLPEILGLPIPADFK
jgi:hypothetical protein